MSSVFFNTVQGIYVAYYGRPADLAGLNFWSSQLANAGGRLETILASFGNSSEANALFGGRSNAEVVNVLFQQLFNRAPDQQGLDFYVTGLQNGTFTPITIAKNILDGAQGTDKTIADRKLQVAQSFTNASGQPDNSGLYDGVLAVELARDLIARVNGQFNVFESETVNSEIQSVFDELERNQQLTENEVPDNGRALSLNLDNLKGTEGNDLFTAIISSAAGASTLQAGDMVDALGGSRDTLQLTIQGVGGTGTSLSSENLKGFEVLKVIDTSANPNGPTGFSSVGLSNFDGLVTLQLGGNSSTSRLDVFGIDPSVSTELSGELGQIRLFLEGGGNSSQLQLKGITGGSVSVNGLQAINGSAPFLSLVTDVGTNNTLGLNLSSQSAGIGISGGGNIKITNQLSGFSSISASQAFGNIELAVSNLGFYFGGLANDKVTYSQFNAATDFFDGGEGRNSVEFLSLFGGTVPQNRVDMGLVARNAQELTFNNSVAVDLLFDGDNINTDTVNHNATALAISQGGSFDLLIGAGYTKDVKVNLSGMNAVVQRVGEGKLTVIAGAGNNQIFGGLGNDDFTGGSGNNIFEGGRGADIIRGGTGDNTYRFSSGDVVAGETIVFGRTLGKIDTIQLLSNTDFSLLNTGNQALTGLDAIDLLGRTATFSAPQLNNLEVEVVSAGTVDIQGTAGADTVNLTNLTHELGANVTIKISTLGGNDNITGSQKVDEIITGAGNNTVRGQGGNDQITLGNGTNTVKFETNQTLNGTDTITGFNFGATASPTLGDVIDIEFGGANLANLAALRGNGTVAQLAGEGATLNQNVGMVIANNANLTDSTAVLGFATGLVGEVAGDIVFLLASDNFNAQGTVSLYRVNYTAVDAANVELLANFNGANLSGIVAANLADWGSIVMM